MKVFIIVSAIFFLTIGPVAKGQRLEVVSAGGKTDSSFYHLTKISNNEFWVGGKNGVLKRIDSLGRISTIQYLNDGLNILKIQRVKNYVFIVTDNSVIYRYDILENVFLKKEFKSFENKCFYDLISLKDGRLMVCGGTKGISKGDKKIPKGFIVLMDEDLNELKVVWRSYRKFIWSLLELDNGEVLASSFNGFNSKILKSRDFSNWNMEGRVKGLVHEITYSQNDVFYSGSKNLKFKDDGILGVKGGKSLVLAQTGCLWSMETYLQKIVAVAANGMVMIVDTDTFKAEQLDLPMDSSVYDIERISEAKFLLVGHGGVAYILHFN